LTGENNIYGGLKHNILLSYSSGYTIYCCHVVTQ